MTWFINDYSRTLIFISNGSGLDYYIPKFRILMDIDGDFVHLYWNDRERGTGGDQRKLSLNYLDVVDSYAGYIDNPSSAMDLAAQIDDMIESAWTNIATGGSILTAKADLLSHDGVSDTILPGGANEFILSRDNTESTGLKWIAKTDIVDGGLSVSNPALSSVVLSKVGSVISATNKIFYYHISAITSWNPVDGSLVFFNGTGNVVNTGSANLKNIILPAGTLIEVDIIWNATGVAGSNESIPLSLRFNDTTDIAIATISDTAAVKRFRNTGLSQAFNGATDFVCNKIPCPTWGTNPTAVGFQGYFKMILS